MTQAQSQPKMLYIASFSELWERFSFYIVEALLVVYLIEMKHLSQIYSYELLGTYISNSFIFTTFGAYFGQYIIGFRSAVNLGAFLMSLGYALLLHSELSYLYHGLSLIAVGSALFKPNMACFVGSLYPRKNSPRYQAAYNIYYGAIMLGVILSTSISGYILDYFGWDVNFSLACFCMILALGVFWLGNQWSSDRQYASNPLTYAPITRWGITLMAVGILWTFMHVALHHANIARIEIILVALALFGYMGLETYGMKQKIRLSFIACIILMFFACIYWALLFQLFFSLNMMVKLVINRHFFQLELPSPMFMGVEAFFVIIFSPILGKIWIKTNKSGYSIGLFSKFTMAFTACSLGFLTLILAFWSNPTPYFPWVILAYAFIGLGEAILAPTALAMIAQLNPPSQVGIMMSILYVFWGFGTKLADVFAQWSIFPTPLHDAVSLSPYFSEAIVAYAGISIIMIVFALIGRKFFRF